MIEKKMNIRCMGCGANVEVDAFCQDGSRRKELICPECGMRNPTWWLVKYRGLKFPKIEKGRDPNVPFRKRMKKILTTLKE